MPLRFLNLLIVLFLTASPSQAFHGDAEGVTRHWLEALAACATETKNEEAQPANLILEAWLGNFEVHVDDASFFVFDEEGLHVPKTITQRSDIEQMFEITRATMGSLLPDLSMKQVLRLTEIYVEKAQEIGLLQKGPFSSVKTLSKK